MLTKINNSTSSACGAFKYVALILLTFLSCLDFQFESEYEDINGIYIEHLHSYTYFGTKILFNGSIGYIATAESLLIYDFTEADAAVYLGYYSAYNSINDFQIYDDCAVLVTDQSLEIVYLGDSLPNQLSGVSFFLLGSHIKVSNDHAFVVSRKWLYVVDISDKQQPVLTGSFEFDDDIKQVEIDSNFAYVLSGTDFDILDIQNPSTPSLVSSTSLATLGVLHPQVFAKKDDFLYYSSWFLNTPTLFACELTGSSTVQPLHYITYPDQIIHFHMSDQYFLAVAWYGAYLINLQSPASPCISEAVGMGGFYGVIQGNLIYIFAPNLAIFEIKQVE